ncbi:MAG: hypothetical protein HY320_10115, partial [Armatimonadetes bacterium]|nr:hypothetical protein [Armatimonadota bacterium]
MKQVMWKPERKLIDCQHERVSLPSDSIQTHLFGPCYYCQDCGTWLSDDPAKRRALRERLSSPGAIPYVVPPAAVLNFEGWRISMAADPPTPVKTGVDEIRRAVKETQGLDLPVSGVDASGPSILIGTPEHHSIRRLISGGYLTLPDGWPGYDGFIAAYLRKRDGLDETMAVIGGNPRGVLYGCLEVARLIRRGELTTRAYVMERPQFKYRGGYAEGENNYRLEEMSITGYFPTEEELKGLAAQRLNVLMLRYNLWRNRHVRYKYLPFVTGAPPWLDDEIAGLQRDLALAKKYGFISLVHFGVSHQSWADAQIFAAYPDAAAARLDDSALYTTFRHICPSHPLLKEYLDAEIREMAELYPELDGFVTFCGYDGASLGCDCDKCREYPYSQRLVDYHRFVHDRLKAYLPHAIMIAEMSSLDMYWRKLAAELPEDVLFTTWSRVPSTLLYPYVHAEDEMEKELGPRYLTQLSSHSEGLVNSTVPVVNLEGLQADIRRAAGRRVAG